MLDGRLKKIARDLGERKGRTLLTLAGLAAGLWGLSAAAVAWLILSHDLDANFLSTNPPAIAITLAGSEPADIAALGPVEGAAAIESRPQFSDRIEIGPDRWLGIIFWVVDDFDDMRVGKFFPESGAFSPPDGQFVAERDGIFLANFYRLRLQVGAVGHRVTVPAEDVRTTRIEEAPVALQLGGGRRIEAQIAGSVFDPRQAPSRMEQRLYGYISRTTAKLWTAGDYNERLLVAPAAGFGDAAAVRRTAAVLEERLRAQGRQVLATRFPSATEHVHQFQMNSILFLLGGLGGLALLMSAVLVVNLVSGLLTAQVRQIGILKAIGASTAQVAGIYLGATAVLGLAAGLIAVPLAVSSGSRVAGTIAAFLNFKIMTTGMPPLFIAALLFIGILFPVVTAAAVVRRWTRVSVTGALQHFGADPLSWTGRLIARLRMPLPLNLRMGLRNGFRRPQRLALTVLTLAVGLVVFLVAMNLRSSLINTAEMEETLKRYDVMVQFDGPVAPNRVAWMSQFGIVERAETWRIAPAIITGQGEYDSAPLPIFLVPDDSDVIQPNILAGEWLGDGQAGAVVINQRLQNANPSLTAGGKITLRIAGKSFDLPIAGVMKEFGGSAIYMRDADYAHLRPDADAGVNVAFVALKEPTEANLARLNALLEQHFTLARVPVKGLTSAKIASRIIRNHLDVIVAMLLIVALLMFAVSSLGMASAMSTSVVERTRELGILRAIGGRPGAIGTILTSESLAMGTLGWGTALALATPVSRYLATYFGTVLVEYPFDYRASLIAPALALLATLIVAGIATIAPALLAHRRTIKEAVAYE